MGCGCNKKSPEFDCSGYSVSDLYIYLSQYQCVKSNNKYTQVDMTEVYVTTRINNLLGAIQNIENGGNISSFCMELINNIIPDTQKMYNNGC